MKGSFRSIISIIYKPPSFFPLVVAHSGARWENLVGYNVKNYWEDILAIPKKALPR